MLQRKNIETYEKKISYRGKLIKINAYFSIETLKDKRSWSDIFQVLQI